MTQIEKPNFTMTPNVFFDEMMQDMKLAELKVTLTVIRETFGWHRAEHELSISYLVEATGLSNRSVIDGLRQGMERGTIYRKTMGKTDNSGYVYGLAMKKLHDPKVKKLHSESEETSQLGSEETSHNKERDKEKGKEKPAPLPPKPVARRTPYRQQQAAEHTKAAKTYGLLPSDFTGLVNAYLIACGTMATANADTDMGNRELTKAKDAAITGLAVGILEPADVEKRVAAFRGSWKDENKQVYYSNIVNQSVGTKNKTAAPAGVAVAMENEY